MTVKVFMMFGSSQSAHGRLDTRVALLYRYKRASLFIKIRSRAAEKVLRLCKLMADKTGRIIEQANKGDRLTGRDCLKICCSAQNCQMRN
jgi:hypothetical protein